MKIGGYVPGIFIFNHMKFAVKDINYGGVAGLVGYQEMNRRAGTEYDIMILQNSDGLVGRCGMVQD